MNKLTKSLMFPAISLLIVAMIYGGLSIANLNNQTKDLQKQNQNITFNVANLQTNFNQLQSEENQTAGINNNLQQNLTAAEKQIAELQKTTSDNSTSNAVATAPAAITKTIIQTIDQPVAENQATVIIDKDGSYLGGIYQVELQAGDNAYTVLERAAEQNKFTIETTNWGGDLGICIDGFNGDDHFSDGKYWAFYYNGVSSDAGVSNQLIFNGDVIEFRIETY
jgi:hypothetical protein